MIIEREDFVVESTITGDQIAMTIDDEALAHIMEMLAGLYSDQELAVLREYSTNARDSHIEAGQARPIEVTLPTGLDPVLCIRDYGVGMNREDIRQIYSRFGASTKRDTDEQVGSFGIGGKSAFAYTSQFWVTGIKNGVKCQILVSRQEDGTGTMTIVEETSTNESNGVEIKIPAARYNDFAAKARKLFRYWEPGSVLVNGAEPSRFEGKQLSDSMFIIDERYEKNTLVMGGVPYPAPDLAIDLPYGKALVAFCPIGSFDPTPSREQIRKTAKSKKFLTQLAESFSVTVKQIVETDIAKAPSRPAALKALDTWRVTLDLRAATYHWRNHEIPRSYQAGRIILVPKDNKWRRVSEHSKSQNLDSTFWSRAIWFYGYDQKFVAAHRRKLDKWCAETGNDAEYFVLVKDKPASPWISKKAIFDWAEVKAMKLPRQGGGNGAPGKKIPGSYFVWNGSQWQETLAADIDQSKPIFWKAATYGNSHIGLLEESHPDCTIVQLPGNRIDKFLRLFPTAESCSAAATRLANKWAEGLNDDQKAALGMHSHYRLRERFKRLDSTRVDDPDVIRAVELAHRDHSVLYSAYERYRRLATVTKFPWTDPLRRYPLLDNIADLRHHADHIYLYMNAAYAARQEENATS